MKKWNILEVKLILAYMNLIVKWLLDTKKLSIPYHVRIYHHIKNGNYKITISTGESGRPIGLPFIKKELAVLLGKETSMLGGVGMIEIDLKSLIEEKISTGKKFKDLFKEIEESFNAPLQEAEQPFYSKGLQSKRKFAPKNKSKRELQEEAKQEISAVTIAPEAIFGPVNIDESLNVEIPLLSQETSDNVEEVEIDVVSEQVEIPFSDEIHPTVIEPIKEEIEEEISLKSIENSDFLVAIKYILNSKASLKGKIAVKSYKETEGVARVIGNGEIQVLDTVLRTLEDNGYFVAIEGKYVITSAHRELLCDIPSYKEEYSKAYRLVEFFAELKGYMKAHNVWGDIIDIHPMTAVHFGEKLVVLNTKNNPAIKISTFMRFIWESGFSTKRLINELHIFIK